MKVIRKNVFETNSSSVHSITVSEKSELFDYPEEKEDVIVVVPGEYGWSGDDVMGLQEKLRYLMTLILATNYDYDSKKREFIPEDRKLDLLKADEDWQRICQVVRDKKHKEVIPNIPKGLNFYVDHQSCMSLDDFLGGISLDDFLFDPTYAVEIDNDNH